jgi:hypothetical protein
VPRDNEEKDDGSRWGIDGGFPIAYVSRFQLIVDGNELTIPRKLFEDLSHVYRVKINEVKRIIHVVISGGNAAGAFDAEYLFKIPKEIERIVRMGEMPKYVWEQTIWHNDFYDKSFDPGY